MSQTNKQSRPLVTTQKAHGAAVGPGQTHRSAVGFPLRRSSFIIPRSSFSRAYTLIEVMVVAVVVLLMLGMALPVFRVITGSRSEAGAANIIAGMLGRARSDAIGLQTTLGVAILYNPSAGLTYVAEVEYPPCQAWVAANQTVNPNTYFYTTISGVNYYFINNSNSANILPAPQIAAPNGSYAVGGPPLELRPNTDLIPLPTGIGVQTICNCTISSGQRTSDGYLNFGVILFDGYGRIISQNYGVSQYSRLCQTSSLYGTDYPTPGQNIGVNGQPGVQSQFGLVVFQREAFTAQGFLTNDNAYNTSIPYDPNQENWLDQNATPLLINRYTGTLIKAE